MVAGPPPLSPTVERAGYRFWEGAEPPEDELGATWGRVPTVSPEEANEIVIGEIFAGLNVRAMLPSLEAACEEWQPDVLIREEAELASAIAAERHGVPHARVGVSLAGLEGMALEFAGARLDEHHRGIAERIWASPYLTFVPAALEDPQRALPPITHRFSDPAAGEQGEPLPDWWSGDQRPLVYVSFGSVVGTMPVAGALYAARVRGSRGAARPRPADAGATRRRHRGARPGAGEPARGALGRARRRPRPSRRGGLARRIRDDAGGGGRRAAARGRAALRRSARQRAPDRDGRGPAS